MDLRRLEVVKRVIMPVKFKRFYRTHRNRRFKLLDIGCGNHSATLTKRYFPNCIYYGVDKDNYNNDDRDFAVMEKFFRIDLEAGGLDSLPDDFFDVIMCAFPAWIGHGLVTHFSFGLRRAQQPGC